jgi:hypothetical protein
MCHLQLTMSSRAEGHNKKFSFAGNRCQTATLSHPGYIYQCSCFFVLLQLPSSNCWCMLCCCCPAELCHNVCRSCQAPASL